MAVFNKTKNEKVKMKVRSKASRICIALSVLLSLFCLFFALHYISFTPKRGLKKQVISHKSHVKNAMSKYDQNTLNGISQIMRYKRGKNGYLVVCHPSLLQACTKIVQRGTGDFGPLQSQKLKKCFSPISSD